MRTVRGGRHCESCARAVVDLTRATELEARVARLLLADQDGRLCGRIRADEDGLALFRKPRSIPSKRLSAAAALALGAAACGGANLPERAEDVAPLPRPSAPTAVMTADAVAETPAPDSDHDGVTDDVDACPNEPGTSMQRGCPFVGIVVDDATIEIRETVLFPAGKKGISAASQPLLDEVARALLEHPEIARVRLEGHSTLGEPKKLDVARAEAVRDYLVKKGVARERLEAAGLGHDSPVDPGTTEEGRAKNRSVTFVVLPPLAAPSSGTTTPT